MNQSNHVVFLTVFFIIVGIAGATAQINLTKWQVGINGGIFVYQGDLTPSDAGSYKTIKPGFGLHVSRVINRSILLRTNIAFGKLYGNDSLYITPAWRKERNYNFVTPVTEISELVVWNMFGNNSNELGQRFSPYLFGGVGVSFLKIRRDTSNFNNHYFAAASNLVNGLRSDMARSTPKTALVLPFGLGMEFYITPKFSLTAETNFRFTLTDYLDGFSLGANPDKNDFYHSHSVGLIYRFGKGNQLGCPPLKR